VGGGGGGGGSTGQQLAGSIHTCFIVSLASRFSGSGVWEKEGERDY